MFKRKKKGNLWSSCGEILRSVMSEQWLNVCLFYAPFYVFERFHKFRTVLKKNQQGWVIDRVWVWSQGRSKRWLRFHVWWCCHWQKDAREAGCVEDKELYISDMFSLKKQQNIQLEMYLGCVKPEVGTGN